MAPLPCTCLTARLPQATPKRLTTTFDNLAAAATNKRDVLNRLVVNNERLTTTNNTTLAEINTLPNNGANTHANRELTYGLVAAAGGGSTSSEVAALKIQLKQLRAAIRFKWMKGGFCYTHGWGFSEGRDIMCASLGGRDTLPQPPNLTLGAWIQKKTKDKTIFGPPVIVVKSV